MTFDRLIGLAHDSVFESLPSLPYFGVWACNGRAILAVLAKNDADGMVMVKVTLAATRGLRSL